MVDSVFGGVHLFLNMMLFRLKKYLKLHIIMITFTVEKSALRRMRDREETC